MISAGIPRSAITPVPDLCLNLGQLSLVAKDRVEAATDVLHELQKEKWTGISNDLQLFTVDLVGVGTWFGSSDSSFLHMSPQLRLYTYVYPRSGRLARFCDGVRSAFGLRGLLFPSGDNKPMLLQSKIASYKTPKKQRAPSRLQHDLAQKFDGPKFHEKYQGTHWYWIPFL